MGIDLYAVLQEQAALFLLMVTRVGGLFMLSPFFGSMNVPVQMRVTTALAVSIAILPAVEATTPAFQVPPTLLGYAGVLLKELFVGWLIGFVAYIAFSAINMAGKVMDMQVGFAMVNVMDPTSGQQIPLIGSFLYNLSLIVFLTTNGHHVLLSALVGSFSSVPISMVNISPSLAVIITQFTTGIFTTGVQVALPVTFTILMVNVGLGILARTMPAINIFVVGVPMQLMLGTFMLSVMLPFYLMFLDVLFNGMYGNILVALRAVR